MLRIPDLGSQIQKQQQKIGVKKICCHTLFCGYKFHKNKNYLIFLMLKKKKLGQFSKNYRTFYSKICHYALKNIGLGFGIRDPGSGKNPDLESRGQKGTLSPIPDPDPQQC